MSVSINELESGMAIRLNDAIYTILELTHVKPGKGAAFVRVRIKNLKTDQVLERTFKTNESIEDVPLEEHRAQNLYQSGDNYHFMNQTTYEEMVVPRALIGDQARFLQDNLVVVLLCLEHQALKVILPNFIICEITHTDLGLKGDSSKSGGKPATIDTGATVSVPLFINTGDFVKIDTRTGSYVERVQK